MGERVRAAAAIPGHEQGQALAQAECVEGNRIMCFVGYEPRVGDVVSLRAVIVEVAGRKDVYIRAAVGESRSHVLIKPMDVHKLITREIAVGASVRRVQERSDKGIGEVMAIHAGHAWVKWPDDTLMTVPLGNLEPMASSAAP